MHRFGLQKELLHLIEKSNIPAAATIMGKSVIGENYPFYLGVYEGAMGREEVRRYVEQSDCLLMLGTFMTDINLGIFTARLNPARCISATSEKLSIRYHNFEGVRFKDFLRGLLDAPLRRRASAKIPRPPLLPAVPSSARGKKSPSSRLFQRLNSFLRDDTIVISDVGDALFGAADLTFISTRNFSARRITLRWDLPCRRPSARNWPIPNGVRWCWSATARFK